MFSIVLTNGKVINIKGDSVEWSEKTHTVRILSGRNTVARINMDNVVGWIDTDNMAESEDK